jgi:hypothetical protein
MLEKDYFEKKRADLGLDRGDQLMKIQATLDKWYPGVAKAKMLHQGTLRILTQSASVAGDLRMRQIEFLKDVGLENTRLAVMIGHF